MSITYSGLEGLQRAESAVDKAASKFSRASLSLSDAPDDTVDLSAEAVALMAARNAFEANAKLVQTGSDLQRSTIDLLA